MGPLKYPPPVRRIVVDDDPTVVEPPKRRNGAAQAVKEAASGLLSAPRKREGKRAEVKQRMETEELGVAYAGKPAVKGVNLPVSEGEVLAPDRPLRVREDDAASLAQPARGPDADRHPQRDDLPRR